MALYYPALPMPNLVTQIRVFISLYLCDHKLMNTAAPEIRIH